MQAHAAGHINRGTTERDGTLPDSIAQEPIGSNGNSPVTQHHEFENNENESPVDPNNSELSSEYPCSD